MLNINPFFLGTSGGGAPTPPAGATVLYWYGSDPSTIAYHSGGGTGTWTFTHEADHLLIDFDLTGAGFVSYQVRATVGIAKAPSNTKMTVIWELATTLALSECKCIGFTSGGSNQAEIAGNPAGFALVTETDPTIGANDYYAALNINNGGAQAVGQLKVYAIYLED